MVIISDRFLKYDKKMIINASVLIHILSGLHCNKDGHKESNLNITLWYFEKGYQKPDFFHKISKSNFE